MNVLRTSVIVGCFVGLAMAAGCGSAGDEGKRAPVAGETAGVDQDEHALIPLENQGKPSAETLLSCHGPYTFNSPGKVCPFGWADYCYGCFHNQGCALEGTNQAQGTGQYQWCYDAVGYNWTEYRFVNWECFCAGE